MMHENAETQSWVTKTVWQWIPDWYQVSQDLMTRPDVGVFMTQAIHMLPQRAACASALYY